MGMTKFIEFKNKTSRGFDENQPVSDEDIYDFIAWAGPLKIKKPNGPDRQIASVTIKKYLDGIRAWHVVKHRTRPTADSEVVKILLTATEQNETKKSLVTEKQPVMIQQLFALVSHAHNRSPKHDLAASTAIIAFWGMARLGELLRNTAEEGAIL